MRYGKIEDNKITEIIITSDINKILHADMAKLFVEVPEEAQEGYVFDGEKWITEEESKLSSAYELKKQCKIRYEKYISKFFTDKELMHMQIALAAGKPKAKAVYDWIESGVKMAFKYQSQIDFNEIPSMDYSFLLTPPYTYEAVMTE